ncbi:hypothetical protein ACFZBU_41930 [Embleya sp. NPDC008237]|uniref:hypothetical protein n=1 Tax=Embleya sp. NPDC008237 TaxID=3363978 RepID=UPI0036EC20F7
MTTNSHHPRTRKRPTPGAPRRNTLAPPPPYPHRPDVDPAQTIAHLARLEAAGMTADDIAERANLCTRTVENIAAGRRSPLATHLADRILAIPARPDIDPCAQVDATGTRRRLQALTAMAHPMDDLARRLNMDRARVATLFTAENVRAGDAARVRVLYDTLQMSPGREPMAARFAELKAWAPPLAWDDQRIDDPTASPDHGPAPKARTRRRYVADEVRHLRGLNESFEAIAGTLDLTPDYLRNLLHIIETTPPRCYVCGTTHDVRPHDGDLVPDVADPQRLMLCDACDADLDQDE